MKKQRPSHFIAIIIMELVELAFMNTVPLWLQYSHGVILPTWSAILWAVNLSLAVRIAINVALAFHRPARFYLTAQAVTGVAGMLSMLVFLIVFPINFGAIGAGWLNTLVVVFTVVGLALGALSVVVNLVKAIRGAEYEEEKKMKTEGSAAPS